MDIKSATQDLHTELENVPFNQRMFRGKQTPLERMNYVLGWQLIFAELDLQVPEFLRRSEYINLDLANLKVDGQAPQAAKEYANSIKRSENTSAHIYLNYMGFLYGGQIMRKHYPETSCLYTFDDLVYARQWIRDNHVFDEQQFYVDEVRTAFKAHIEISKQLDEMNVG